MTHKKWIVFFTLTLLVLLPLFPATTIWADDSSALDDIAEYYGEEWDPDVETPTISDPWQGYNRFMFKFNNKFYDYLLNPISTGYDFIVPEPVQGSIDNLFTNARMPIRFFNCLFQGKIKGAWIEMWRFIINSTTGLGGFFDTAKKYHNLEFQDEDFGQTLGHYGMGPGIYIVWPIIGPSSIRDTLGFAGDAALNPMTWLYIVDVQPEEALLGASSVARINSYSYNIRDNYDSLIESAVDPYIAIQDAYIQSRTKKINE